MDYVRVLSGNEKTLEIYDRVVTCLENIHALPDLVETIYRESLNFDEDTLDRFRFALIRLQVYADIHRYEDLEKAQKIKYVAQVLEKIVFGSLLLEPDEFTRD